MLLSKSKKNSRLWKDTVKMRSEKNELVYFFTFVHWIFNLLRRFFFQDLRLFYWFNIFVCKRVEKLSVVLLMKYSKLFLGSKASITAWTKGYLHTLTTLSLQRKNFIYIFSFQKSDTSEKIFSKILTHWNGNNLKLPHFSSINRM